MQDQVFPIEPAMHSGWGWEVAGKDSSISKSPDRVATDFEIISSFFGRGRLAILALHG